MIASNGSQLLFSHRSQVQSILIDLDLSLNISQFLLTIGNLELVRFHLTFNLKHRRDGLQVGQALWSSSVLVRPILLISFAGRLDLLFELLRRGNLLFHSHDVRMIWRVAAAKRNQLRAKSFEFLIHSDWIYRRTTVHCQLRAQASILIQQRLQVELLLVRLVECLGRCLQTGLQAGEYLYVGLQLLRQLSQVSRFEIAEPLFLVTKILTSPLRSEERRV